MEESDNESWDDHLVINANSDFDSDSDNNKQCEKKASNNEPQIQNKQKDTAFASGSRAHRCQNSSNSNYTNFSGMECYHMNGNKSTNKQQQLHNENKSESKKLYVVPANSTLLKSKTEAECDMVCIDIQKQQKYQNIEKDDNSLSAKPDTPQPSKKISRQLVSSPTITNSTIDTTNELAEMRSKIDFLYARINELQNQRINRRVDQPRPSVIEEQDHVQVPLVNVNHSACCNERNIHALDDKIQEYEVRKDFVNNIDNADACAQYSVCEAANQNNINEETNKLNATTSSTTIAVENDDVQVITDTNTNEKPRRKSRYSKISNFESENNKILNEKCNRSVDPKEIQTDFWNTMASYSNSKQQSNYSAEAHQTKDTKNFDKSKSAMQKKSTMSAKKHNLYDKDTPTKHGKTPNLNSSIDIKYQESAQQKYSNEYFFNALQRTTSYAPGEENILTKKKFSLADTFYRLSSPSTVQSTSPKINAKAARISPTDFTSQQLSALQCGYINSFPSRSPNLHQNISNFWNSEAGPLCNGQNEPDKSLLKQVFLNKKSPFTTTSSTPQALNAFSAGLTKLPHTQTANSFINCANSATDAYFAANCKNIQRFNNVMG